MSNNVFHFKSFSIRQPRAAMKVSADAVLFGACIPDGNYTNILDIGTGTGLLAVMTATRFTNAYIDAVEIDDLACLDAFENVKNAGFSQRIQVFATHLQNFKPTHSYDLIICNPPFFTESLQSENEKRMLARHDTSLEPSAIFSFASEHLQSNGKVYVMYPAQRLSAIKTTAMKHGFYTETLFTVHKNTHSPARLVFVVFNRNAAKPVENTLYIYHENNQFSRDYKKLVEPYYLKLE